MKKKAKEEQKPKPKFCEFCKKAFKESCKCKKAKEAAAKKKEEDEAAEEKAKEDAKTPEEKAAEQEALRREYFSQFKPGINAR